ncbi:uncharacterized protein LOC111276651 [Durio zibethinus]|uniref:Uncharacterized protein LOC111276651 n=1 Tax=Durio zibethinus TaxID=66656 RepID=A0A6P5WRI9_DURZI|nr:uncharacterized protein LOC111276651 [Durio zibethinus]
MGSQDQFKNVCPFITRALNSRSWPRGHKKRRKLKKYNTHMKVLKAEMEEVRLEQKGIKDGQRLLQDKLKAVEAECNQLRRETALIIEQSANTQLRLALMFQILKARENNDFCKAAELSQALRELIMEQNK